VLLQILLIFAGVLGVLGLLSEIHPSRYQSAQTAARNIPPINQESKVLKELPESQETEVIEAVAEAVKEPEL
jgi:hypothetical protein